MLKAGCAALSRPTGYLKILERMIHGDKKMKGDLEEKPIQRKKAKNEKKQYISKFIEQNFLVQPCFNCHEFKMRLLDISPNNRSIHYQCVHCGKKCVLLRGHLRLLSWVTFGVTIVSLST
jgi:hypothetical protein